MSSRDQYGRASRWGQHKNAPPAAGAAAPAAAPPPAHRSAPAANSNSINNTRTDKGAVAQHGSLDQKAVSDADALRALLSSADAREQERVQVSKSSGTDNNNNNNNNGNKRSRFDNPNNRANNNSNNDASKRRRGGQDDDRRNNNSNNDSYYGPQHNNNAAGNGRDDRRRVVENDEVDRKHSNKEGEEEEEAEKPVPDIKPNFGLSGALTKDEGSSGSNVYKGIVLKFREPPEARAPNTLWRFYVFKGQELLETLHISKQSAYLLGRNADICDIHMAHPSLSGQHAVLQYRALPTKQDPLKVSCQPYIMDLESTNGTFLNTVRIDAARYYQLKKGDVVTFGASKREFVLLTENTTSIK